MQHGGIRGRGRKRITWKTGFGDELQAHMARLRFSLDRGEQSSCVCGRDLSWRYLRPQCREPRLLGRLSSNWMDVLSFKADGWKGARVLDQL